MRHQSTPRKSGARGAAVARRLLANVGIAQSVLNATIYDEQLSDAVVTFKAGRNFTLNGLKVVKGEKFTMVKSKFAHRYYVCNQAGEWSTKDIVTIARCQVAMAKTVA